MKNFTSYFYHVKGEHDNFPEIIDFISHYDFINHFKVGYLKEFYKLLNNIELNVEEMNFLNEFLEDIHFSENHVKLHINKFIRIPFGYYYIMKASDYSLVPLNEHNFNKFYYF